MRCGTWLRRAARVCLLVGAAGLFLHTRADAQAVTLQGDHFRVDGQDRYLLFLSYFDAMRASEATLDHDFTYISQTLKLDGVRIIANWWDDSSGTRSFARDTLMSVNSGLRLSRLAKLKVVLDKARAKGLVVDLSLARETVCDDNPSPTAGAGCSAHLNVGNYQTQIVALVNNLAAEPARFNHVLIDLQNEFDDAAAAQHLSFANVISLAGAAHGADVSRLLMASTTEATGPGSPGGTGGTNEIVASAGLDVAAYHDPRNPVGISWWDNAYNVVVALRQALRQPPNQGVAAVKPIYLQEPQPWQDDQTGWHHHEAAKKAKLAGAAAWTFHTRTGFVLADNNPGNNLANSYAVKIASSAEKTAVEALRAAVDTPNVPWNVCRPVVTPATPAAVPAAGGTVTLHVDVRSDCDWTTTESASWIAITSGAQGTGAADVVLTIDPLAPGASRTPATVVVAGQAVTISQSTNACPFTLTPSHPTLWPSAYTSTITVTTVAGCTWSAQSNQGWLTITGGASGTGSGVVSITTTANRALTARNAIVTIGGQQLALSQRRRGAPADYDGDGRSDYAIYRPSTGWWWIRHQTGGYIGRPFGLTSDVPKTLDWDGDGRTDLALFRPATGDWYFALAADDYAYSAQPLQWGGAGDVPLTGDFDGDGRSDLVVFRPSTNTWWIRYRTGAIVNIGFGVTNDIPQVLDWDNDGKSDLAVYRPSTGNWYVALAANNFWYDGIPVHQWGLPGSNDYPIADDYDGDGYADLAVFRPPTSGWWIYYQGPPYQGVGFGVSGDVPGTLDVDGDGRADLVVFRPGVANWYYALSAQGFWYDGVPTQWGLPGDIPIFSR